MTFSRRTSFSGRLSLYHLPAVNLPDSGHDPVLYREVLDTLAPHPGQVFVDCTLGRGGHAGMLAEKLGPTGLLLACDVDPRNMEFARERLSGSACPIRFFHANFAELPDVLEAAGVPAVDGLLADLGLSTNQLFDPHYGLSFAEPMPLDMRIDPRLDRTAADLVQLMREEDLANLLYQRADERFSRRIAKKIVEARRLSPITTTDRLADIVRSVVPKNPKDKIDPATRTFMALRIAVNHEIENLERLLEHLPTVLKPAGRAGIISFQSTEDRIVKQAFRIAEQTGRLKIVTKKPLGPQEDEVEANPRSRSAKLRVVERPI